MNGVLNIARRRRLLAVQGPLQFLAGLIALEWMSDETSVGDEVVLLMYDFLMDAAIEPEFAAVIERLSAIRPWKRIVFLDASSMDAMLAGRYRSGIAALHAALGETAFDEIYLARDFCGRGSPLIGNAYQGAKKMAYGDSLGLVADRANFADYDASRPVRSLLSACKRTLRRALLGGPRRYTFDAAVLSLPIDLSHGELASMPMLVPSACHVRQTIRAVAEPLDSLRDYSRSLIEFAGDTTAHLCLLSNLSASGLMSQENEIALYVDVLTATVAPGDTVFLKVHPRSVRQVIDAVTKALTATMRIKVIDDAALARLPVELWSDLLDACSVIAIFSTAAVNIKYIYDKDVILPLNNALIERYVLPAKVAYIKTVQRMIDEATAALDGWDGQSVLWKKHQ